MTSTGTIQTVREISDAFLFEARKETCKVRLVIDNFYKEDGKYQMFESSSFTSGGSHGIQSIQWRVKVFFYYHDDERKVCLACQLSKICKTPSNYIEKTVSFHFMKSNGDLGMLRDGNVAPGGLPMGDYWWTHKTVLDNEKALSPSGALTIVCDLCLTYPTVPQRLGINLIRTTESQNIGFRSLYESRLNSDVTLKCRGKEFRAHKRVLSARSPVFREMFLTPLRNVVEMRDAFPEEAIQAMLKYAYIGETGDLDLQTWIHLHSVADKYDLEELKSRCSRSIVEHLKVENACEVALLAHLNCDKELLSTTKGFFRENYPDIVTSPDWTSLITEHEEFAKKLVKK